MVKGKMSRWLSEVGEVEVVMIRSHGKREDVKVIE